MSTAIDTARLVRLQARALLRFLERKGLVLSRGDPVKEIWADVAAFADGTRDLSGLTQIWQRNSMSARDATCVGVNHECVNAAVFLALYRFCRETEAYRPAAVTPLIAFALAFKAGRRHCTDDEQRLLFEEFEEEVEAAYRSAGLGPGATG
ncbi:MAG: hypothetical protein IPI51_09005 [Betaproteobacteria bacterium]|nr:hypothetical protein [Betaproteobacteria bacterium]